MKFNSIIESAFDATIEFGLCAKTSIKAAVTAFVVDSRYHVTLSIDSKYQILLVSKICHVLDSSNHNLFSFFLERFIKALFWHNVK